ncbi:hypothetical protein SAMN05216243_2847 [Sediminibacillus albus]|uniref:Uncharacterized protein n=1 Tax=Sediminibacillus albus TaxID=407036 RepID=A0A1G9B752_9BACI|nr:hypothetical protein SAMN05216243_2847 [Sediminibacillus albus]
MHSAFGINIDKDRQLLSLIDISCTVKPFSASEAALDIFVHPLNGSSYLAMYWLFIMAYTFVSFLDILKW